MEKYDRFSEKDFISPPDNIAPVYNWMWNGVITEDEIDRQLDEMVSLGIKAVAIIPLPKGFRPTTMPTLMEPDYLTDSYLELYSYAVKSAKSRNIHMWLYDEGGWPSGSACGKVVLQHPEYAKEHLCFRRLTFDKGDVYKSKDALCAAFDENGNYITDGFVFDKKTVACEYYSAYCRFEAPGNPEVADLTKAESTEAFIDITLERYKDYIGGDFGDTVKAVFTDEPAMPFTVPYRKETAELFEKENGYSILPYLPELYADKASTEEGALARIAWFDLCSRLLCENFLQKEKEWTNENSMEFIGHMNGDHTVKWCCTYSGAFHVLRALRRFDIPGIDVIWRQIFPTASKNPDNTHNGIFPRYASSAAVQTGARYSLSESFAVYGEGLTFEQMRYVVNFQAVRGINIFNFFGVPYHRGGFLMTGELPYFTAQHACYADLGTFNSYLERVCYLSSLGESRNDVALYMPVNDMWAGNTDIGFAYEKVGEVLEDSRIPFDIVDDDVFAECDTVSLNSGKISIGKASYSLIVVPPCEYMPENTAECLSEFIKNGGRVLVINGASYANIPGAEYVDDLSRVLVSPLKIGGETDKVRLGVRVAENGTLYMLFNEAENDRTFTVSADNYYVLSAESGRILRPRSNTVTLKSGETAFLWQGEADSFEYTTEFTGEIELNGEYKIRPTKRFIIGDMNYISEEYNSEFTDTTLGDWKNIVGNEFSGSCIYEKVFPNVNSSGKIAVDLGDVRCTAEVFLNGKSLGIRVMPPYRYELSGDILKDENTLTVRVSNTAANEYNYTKSFDKWKTWQMSPYYEAEKEFHKESLFGGLYGPVKILYE